MVFSTIQVSDPRTEEEGTRQKYTSYLILSRGQHGETSVRRRYSDFQWLFRRLRTEKPGAIVPIIMAPSSQSHRASSFMAMASSSRKFDPEFIEDRRRSLQQFMDDVMDHDELSNAPSMRPFLLDPLGSEFEDGKRKIEAKTPTDLLLHDNTEEDYGVDGAGSDHKNIHALPGGGGGGGSVRKGLGNLFAKIRVSAGSKELIATAGESQVVSLNEYMTEVSNQTKSLVKTSDALVKLTSDMATAYDELGFPIGCWRTSYQQQEQQMDGVMDMMTTLCEFSNEYSTLLRKKHIEEEQQFAFKMHRLSHAVSAFQMALKQRKNMQLNYTATNKQIIDKDAALTKARKHLKPPEITDKLKEERSELENRSDLERKLLEECTQRLLRDADKYKPRLDILLKDAFLQYSKLQLSYTHRMHHAFSQLVPYLEKQQQEDSSGGYGDTTVAGGSVDETAFTSPTTNDNDNLDDDIEVEPLDGSNTSLGSTGAIARIESF